ncbi:MAG: magnesium transporter [Lachnospiraceae bacterium]|nr:magnesium transporter [Lachnospiraceae bacterium]
MSTELLENERVDYEKEIIELIRSDKSAAEKKDLLSDYHENDIAAVLSELDSKERKKLYMILGLESVSEIFAYLDDPEEFIEELDEEVAADILENMEADDAVDILEELEDEKSEALIQLMEDEAREDIDLIQSYNSDEIGSKMTTNFVTLKLGLTIRQAMKSMVSQAENNDNISTLYVLKDDDTFYGAIDLTDLIVARDYVDMETLVTTSYPFVYDHENIDDVIEELKGYSEDSIPVLDQDKHILGVITSQDMTEIVDEEMGEDYARLAGLSEEEDLEEPLLASLKKRTPWLIVLLFLGMIVATVTGTFEGVIAGIPTIVFFQSVILGMSGNVGTQTLAVTIRVLMDEELTSSQQFKFVFKEIRIGFCNGLIVGLISLFVTGMYIHFIKGFAFPYAFAMSGCIGCALWVAMIISSFVGAMVPIVFTKLKVDPAVASGPLISTMNDLVAVITYYGMALMLLVNVMHLDRL